MPKSASIPYLTIAFTIVASILFLGPHADVVVAAPDDETPSEKAAARDLKRALAANDREGIALTVPVFAQGASIKDIQLLLQIGVQYPEEDIYPVVREALVANSDDAAIAFFHRFVVRPKDTKVTILMLEVLSRIERPAAIPPLVEALEKGKDTVLLVEIVRALGAKPSKEVVRALIDFLAKVEKKGGELWIETRVSLVEITGEDFAIQEDWARWWKTNEATWVPKDQRDGRGTSRTGVFRRDRERPDIEIPTVWGIELPVKRLVFILDTSKSMEQPFEGWVPEQGASEDDRPTRLEAAKQELIGAIELLKRDVKFTVITYSTELKPLSGENTLVNATPSNKRKAQEFVRSLKPGGKTSTEIALMSALAVPDVRTIVLISDGIPTHEETGKPVPMAPIVDRVSADNRFKRVAIHSIGLVPSLAHFLSALSDRNNGTFKLVK